MIHAFLAGFAGCLGALAALWCWNGIREWLAWRHLNRLYQPSSPGRQRAIAWTCVCGAAALSFAVFNSMISH
jgi:hypothetical protein